MTLAAKRTGSTATCSGVLNISGLPPDPPHIRGASPGTTSVLHALAALTGVSLGAGYRTQVIGGITAAIEIWLAVFGPGEPLAHILLATFATGLALQGPGSWSIDVRLAGWERIEIPRRRP